ncbi:MAG: riboflavin synthase [Actinomycetota bacterium]
MFTGIVTDRGEIRHARKRRGLLELEVGSGAARELGTGDSVSLNGVCLTATRVHRKRFSVQAVEETLARTTLGDVRRGDRVNVELAARASDRLGGHLVQGHVDGVAEAVRVEDEGASKRMWWRADEGLVRYLAPKGSVALDGVSLTVVDAGTTTFEIAVIPHTLDVTSLDEVVVGSRANLEVDVVAKYVERLLAAFPPSDTSRGRH